MKAAITAIAYATGSNRVGLDEMRARFGTETADKIAAMSGILERRAVDANTCASDLAENAARLLFDSSLASPESIDLLIFATQTPDYAMPSNACIMQDRIGLGKSCAAFDINLGCSQFPYALATAGAWLEASLARRALVITADTATRLIHPMDKSAVSLFRGRRGGDNRRKIGRLHRLCFRNERRGLRRPHLPDFWHAHPPHPARFRGIHRRRRQRQDERQHENRRLQNFRVRLQDNPAGGERTAEKKRNGRGRHRPFRFPIRRAK